MRWKRIVLGELIYYWILRTVVLLLMALGANAVVGETGLAEVLHTRWDQI